MSEIVLGESLELLIDNRGKNPRFEQNGVPVVSAMLVHGGRVHLGEARHVSMETYRQWMPFPTRRNDVLLTSEAPLGRVALVPDDEPLVLAQRIYGLRGKQGVLDSRFLFYAFQTEKVQEELRGRATGTTVTGIRQSELVKVKISVPSYREQQAIAAVLGALDDKIAINDRIARGCEDFLSLELAHWMHSHADMVTESPLSSMASFVNGRAFTKDATGTGRMVIRIAEINSGPSGSTVYNEIDVPDEHLARPGDVLFAWSGSLAVTRWFRTEGIINQHIFKVTPNSGVPRWLIFKLINKKLSMFKGIAADKATTMGHIQRRHLDEIVAVPAQDEIRRLDAELGPLWDRALIAEQESLKLAELRDTLLPKLMSGEIRVRDAEKVVEDVT